MLVLYTIRVFQRHTAAYMRLISAADPLLPQEPGDCGREVVDGAHICPQDLTANFGKNAEEKICENRAFFFTRETLEINN